MRKTSLYANLHIQAYTYVYVHTVFKLSLVNGIAVCYRHAITQCYILYSELDFIVE